MDTQIPDLKRQAREKNKKRGPGGLFGLGGAAEESALLGGESEAAASSSFNAGRSGISLFAKVSRVLGVMFSHPLAVAGTTFALSMGVGAYSVYMNGSAAGGARGASAVRSGTFDSASGASARTAGASVYGAERLYSASPASGGSAAAAGSAVAGGANAAAAPAAPGTPEAQGSNAAGGSPSADASAVAASGGKPGLPELPAANNAAWRGGMSGMGSLSGGGSAASSNLSAMAGGAEGGSSARGVSLAAGARSLNGLAGGGASRRPGVSAAGNLSAMRPNNYAGENNYGPAGPGSYAARPGGALSQAQHMLPLLQAAGGQSVTGAGDSANGAWSGSTSGGGSNGGHGGGGGAGTQYAGGQYTQCSDPSGNGCAVAASKGSGSTTQPGAGGNDKKETTCAAGDTACQNASKVKPVDISDWKDNIARALKYMEAALFALGIASLLGMLAKYAAPFPPLQLGLQIAAAAAAAAVAVAAGLMMKEALTIAFQYKQWVLGGILGVISGVLGGLGIWALVGSLKNAAKTAKVMIKQGAKPYTNYLKNVFGRGNSSKAPIQGADSQGAAAEAAEAKVKVPAGGGAPTGTTPVSAVKSPGGAPANPTVQTPSGGGSGAPSAQTPSGGTSGTPAVQRPPAGNGTQDALFGSPKNSVEAPTSGNVPVSSPNGTLPATGGPPGGIQGAKSPLANFGKGGDVDTSSTLQSNVDANTSANLTSGTGAGAADTGLNLNLGTAAKVVKGVVGAGGLAAGGLVANAALSGAAGSPSDPLGGAAQALNNQIMTPAMNAAGQAASAADQAYSAVQGAAENIPGVKADLAGLDNINKSAAGLIGKEAGALQNQMEAGTSNLIKNVKSAANPSTAATHPAAPASTTSAAATVSQLKDQFAQNHAKIQQIMGSQKGGAMSTADSTEIMNLQKANAWIAQQIQVKGG